MKLQKLKLAKQKCWFIFSIQSFLLSISKHLKSKHPLYKAGKNSQAIHICEAKSHTEITLLSSKTLKLSNSALCYIKTTSF